ncbi:hypothetical protein [Lewinella cohaerens]|uniref:hypothetical protein n=1 Tax=Lewinella cohaerens TaxID=70995 RepID=UPI0012EB60D4|nr:hypothetical protein [Lewinella cohaerens]
MISINRLALFFLLIVWSFSLYAQSTPSSSRHWQLSGGIQYSQGRSTNSHAVQPLDAFSYGGNLEYVCRFPKLTTSYFVYMGFQQLRAEGKDIAVAGLYGLEETLRIDNVVFGPGFELKLNNKGNYQAFLGAQAFWGFSIDSEYSFENVGMTELLILPAAYQVKGGAGLYNAGQVFAGLERVFTEKIQLRLKAGLGEHFQFASWQLPELLYLTQSDRNNVQLIKGGYWQASLEVVCRL